MLHAIAEEFAKNFTVPHVIVVTLLGFVGRIAWDIVGFFKSRTEREIAILWHFRHGHKNHHKYCDVGFCAML